MTGEGDPLDRWMAWLETIQQEVWRMHIRRTIWRRFIEVVNGNTALLEHSTFPEWATKNYADAQSLAIRRQTDNRTDSVSLRRLLIELAAQPEAITRERFVRVNCHSNEKIAAHLWPDVADPTGQHVNLAMVQGDLDVPASDGEHCGAVRHEAGGVLGR